MLMCSSYLDHIIICNAKLLLRVSEKVFPQITIISNYEMLVCAYVVLFISVLISRKRHTNYLPMFSYGTMK